MDEIMEKVYADHFSSALKHVLYISRVDPIIPENASNILVDAYNCAVVGDYSESKKQFSLAWNILSDYDPPVRDSSFFRLLGNILVSQLILENMDPAVELDLFDSIEADLVDNSIDETSAFCWLWLAFEVSNGTDYESLFSIATLFSIPTVGWMITATGFVQTMPPSRHPELFAIIALYMVSSHIGTEISSRGDLSKKRLLVEDIKRPDHISTERRESFKNYIDRADAFIGKLTIRLQQIFGPELDSKAVNELVNKPMSREANVTYWDLFNRMVRNFKIGFGVPKYQEIFSRSPIGFDEAIKLGNQYAILTRMYAKTAEGYKYKDINFDISNLAIKMFEDGRYSLASQLADEAYSWNGSSESLRLKEQCYDALFDEEMAAMDDLFS